MEDDLKNQLSPIISLSLVCANVSSCFYFFFTTFELIFGGQNGVSGSNASLATLEEALARSRIQVIMVWLQIPSPRP
jgi:hypothetical protein